MDIDWREYFRELCRQHGRTRVALELAVSEAEIFHWQAGRRRPGKQTIRILELKGWLPKRDSKA